MGLVCTSCSREKDKDDIRSSDVQQAKINKQALQDYIVQNRYKMYTKYNMDSVINIEKSQPQPPKEQYNHWKKQKNSLNPEKRPQSIYNLTLHNPLDQSGTNKISGKRTQMNMEGIIIQEKYEDQIDESPYQENSDKLSLSSHKEKDKEFIRKRIQKSSMIQLEKNLSTKTLNMIYPQNSIIYNESAFIIQLWWRWVQENRRQQQKQQDQQDNESTKNSLNNMTLSRTQFTCQDAKSSFVDWCSHNKDQVTKKLDFEEQQQQKLLIQQEEIQDQESKYQQQQK